VCCDRRDTGGVPQLPFSRRQALAAAAVLVAALVVGSRLLSHPATPAAAPVPVSEGTTPPPQPRLVVDVVGAVRRPGLYRLAAGARVADALTHAGGPTPKADLEQVNLAAPVADGQQIVVPRRVPSSAPPAAGAEPAQTGPVHLNTATLEQLDSLPGVGPVTAQKILDYRTQHGGFRSVDELDAISGIGPARLDQLRGLAMP
jgi:competence protein ComEA